MIRIPNRADDDKVVALLRFRQLGYRVSDIERHLGMPHNTGSVLIRRVLTDDLKHSGEGEATVRAGYEWGRA